MKKFSWLLVGVMVTGLVLGGIGLANAGTSVNVAGSSTATMSRFMGSKGNGVSLRNTGSQESDIASFLGMTVSELETARKSGKSLATIATEHGKTEDALIQFIVAKRTDDLKTLLSNGKITQIQYDNALSQMTARVKLMVERTEAGSPTWAKSTGRNKNMTGSGNCAVAQRP